MLKTSTGNFFEDFKIGQVLEHATPRTVRESDITQYQALTGSRFAVQSAETVAKSTGLERSPVDDLLMFHIVFGKSVPDISQNAVANLGYAQCQFKQLVYPGDTLSARSTVIGLKENSNGKTGVVYVRTEGIRNGQDVVLEFVRWVMVRKRDEIPLNTPPVIPDLADHVAADRLSMPIDFRQLSVKAVETGSAFAFEDYEVGEKIDHIDGMGVMESEHRLATRLYQNTAKVHFNDFSERQGRLGATIVYGGVVISIARALSFNGLANALGLLAINAGRHVNPCIAGDTVFAWSQVLGKAQLRADAGALRLRLIATKNRPCHDFPRMDESGSYLPDILLDLDYWVLVPSRQGLLA